MGIERGGGKLSIQETISMDDIKAATSRLQCGKALSVGEITTETMKSRVNEVAK